MPHVRCDFCRSETAGGECYPVLPYGDGNYGEWKLHPEWMRLPITDYDVNSGTGILHFQCNKCCQRTGKSIELANNEPECKLLLPDCEWGTESECKYS